MTSKENVHKKNKIKRLFYMILFPIVTVFYILCARAVAALTRMETNAGFVSLKQVK